MSQRSKLGLIPRCGFETHEGWFEDKRNLDMDVLWEARSDQLAKSRMDVSDDHGFFSQLDEPSPPPVHAGAARSRLPSAGWQTVVRRGPLGQYYIVWQ